MPRRTEYQQQFAQGATMPRGGGFDSAARALTTLAQGLRQDEKNQQDQKIILAETEYRNAVNDIDIESYASPDALGRDLSALQKQAMSNLVFDDQAKREIFQAQLQGLGQQAVKKFDVYRDRLTTLEQKQDMARAADSYDAEAVDVEGVPIYDFNDPEAANNLRNDLVIELKEKFDGNASGLHGEEFRLKAEGIADIKVAAFEKKQGAYQREKRAALAKTSIEAASDLYLQDNLSLADYQERTREALSLQYGASHPEEAIEVLVANQTEEAVSAKVKRMAAEGRIEEVRNLLSRESFASLLSEQAYNSTLKTLEYEENRMIAAAKDAEAQAQRQQKQSQNVTKSEIALSIEQASSREDLAVLQNEINNNPLFETSSGQIIANGLRIAITRKQKKIIEGHNLSIIGEQFVSGELPYNAANPDHKKAFNKYAENALTQWQGVDGASRSALMASVINTVGDTPDNWKGYIKNLSRSLRPEDIAEMTDLYAKVAETNQYLLHTLGSNQDIARPEMIKKRLDAGYGMEQAISTVDQLLAPENAVNIADAEQHLRDNKVDYKAEVINLFGGNGMIFDSFDADKPSQSRVVSVATDTYRITFQDHYRLTHDLDMARTQAERDVQAMFGLTDINGNTELMQYPPQWYYVVEDSDGDWMRDQMISVTEQALKSTDQEYSSDYVEDNLRLVTVPYVTEKFARLGQPRYKLVLQDEDGTLIDVLGQDQYFKFDPELEKARLIQKAKNDVGAGFIKRNSGWLSEGKGWMSDGELPEAITKHPYDGWDKK